MSLPGFRIGMVHSNSHVHTSGYILPLIVTATIMKQTFENLLARKTLQRHLKKYLFEKLHLMFLKKTTRFIVSSNSFKIITYYIRCKIGVRGLTLLLPKKQMT